MVDDARIESLVRRTLDGDTQAFGEVIEEYQTILFNVALRMTHDREDARDLVQTAFFKAYRGLHTWDPAHRFFSWIYRILINETLNLLRRRRPAEELDEGLPSHEPSPDTVAHRNQLEEQVGRALMMLTTEKREVIVLRHLQGQSYREMSETLGIPEKTVKSRLHDARRALGALLERQGVRA